MARRQRMFEMNLIWAAASQINPGIHPRQLYRRVRFLLCAAVYWRDLSHVLRCGTPFQNESLRLRPQAIGLIEWPYIHSEWTVSQRLSAFKRHYDLVDQKSFLGIPVGGRLDLCALNQFEPGLSLVLDRPIWFLREGEVCLNLFLKETRIYTIAFNLGSDEQGSLTVTVGGIQGRNIQGVKEIYGQLTKSLHGVRPRDFLIGVLMLLCEELGVHSIRGVSDQFRHHRSNYFGGKGGKPQSSDYDEIWLDRGGVLASDGFFHIKAALVERSLDDIPSKKRAMYRRRKEMYDDIRKGLAAINKNPPVFAPQLPG